MLLVGLWWRGKNRIRVDEVKGYSPQSHKQGSPGANEKLDKGNEMTIKTSQKMGHCWGLSKGKSGRKLVTNQFIEWSRNQDTESTWDKVSNMSSAIQGGKEWSWSLRGIATVRGRSFLIKLNWEQRGKKVNHLIVTRHFHAQTGGDRHAKTYTEILNPCNWGIPNGLLVATH